MKESNFEVIPAIDILDGKCVRLTQGNYSQVEEFSTNPKDIAKKWVDNGAKRLHIVDLNGAKTGYPANFKVISNICKSCGAKVQVGGGIRTHQTIKDYFNEEVSYVVLGTRIFKDKVFLKEVQEQYGKGIIISLDLKNKKVATSGWSEAHDISLSELSDSLKAIEQIIYTDTTKDGTLSGPNIESIEKIASLFKSRIIVSGGISSLEDLLSILNIKNEQHPNISGVILGKSLYKGKINLTQAIELINKNN